MNDTISSGVVIVVIMLSALGLSIIGIIAYLIREAGSFVWWKWIRKPKNEGRGLGD